jgi:hypothetical protein
MEQGQVGGEYVQLLLTSLLDLVRPVNKLSINSLLWRAAWCQPAVPGSRQADATLAVAT